MENELNYSISHTCTCARHNAQKMKFSIKDFFSKYDQIRSFLWIWSHSLKKSLTEIFIFCARQKELLRETPQNSSSEKISQIHRKAAANETFYLWHSSVKFASFLNKFFIEQLLLTVNRYSCKFALPFFNLL